VSKHHTVGGVQAATDGLGSNQAFTITVPPDPAGPTQVLTPTPGANVFLIIRYSL
jgi:hypothetical protein